LQVADFGLTKLIDVGSSSLHTANMKGTFGYMPPEYDELCFSLLSDTFLLVNRICGVWELRIRES